MLVVSTIDVFSGLIWLSICLTRRTVLFWIRSRTQMTRRTPSLNIILKNLRDMWNKLEKTSGWIQMKCARRWRWSPVTQTARYSSMPTSRPISTSCKKRSFEISSRQKSMLSEDIRETIIWTRRSQSNRHSWISMKTTSLKMALNTLVIHLSHSLHLNTWKEMSQRILLKLSLLRTLTNQTKRWSKITCTLCYSNLIRSH